MQQARSWSRALVLAAAVCAAAALGACDEADAGHTHDHDHDHSQPDAASGDAVGDTSLPAGEALVDNTAWTVIAAEVDPFASAERPAADVCPASDSGPELTPDGVWFEVSTEGCAWFTGAQPLAVALAAGDEVRVRFIHGEVEVGETDYELAIALGEPMKVVWSKTVLKGAGEATFDETFTLAEAYAAGVPVRLHLSNHGANTWQLAVLERVTR